MTSKLIGWKGGGSSGWGETLNLCFTSLRPPPGLLSTRGLQVWGFIFIWALIAKHEGCIYIS